MLTLSEIAERVATPGLLNSKQVRRNMTAVLGRVSHDALSLFGFECRLGASGDPVDFALAFGASEAEGLRRSAAALSAQSPASSLFPGLQLFAERWQRSARLRADVPYLWLEYDGDTIKSGSPPGVFLGSPPSRPSHDDPTAWVADRYNDIEGISGCELSPALVAEADRCVAACPTGVNPELIGFFLGRAHAGLRLCLGGFDLWDAGDYLKRLGYRGDVARFVAEVLDIRAGARGILDEIGLLHIDVLPDGIAPRIGVEFVFEVDRQISQHRVDTDVLEALIGKGLAARAKCEELTAWPGATCSGDDDPALYLRRLNHIKLVFAGDRILEAKAYFFIRRGVPEFVPAASVRRFDCERS